MICLLSQHVWGQLLVLGSLHSQSTVDGNYSLGMLNRQIHRKANILLFNPLLCLWMCYEICIQYGFTEQNKDTSINTECPTYILIGGIHFDLLIRVKCVFFSLSLSFLTLTLGIWLVI